MADYKLLSIPPIIALLVLLSGACSLLDPDSPTPKGAYDYARMTSDSAALAIEQSILIANGAYKLSQDALVAEATALDLEPSELSHNIATVRAAWAPVWPAIKKAKALHTELVTLLEREEVDPIAVSRQLMLLSGAQADVARQLAKPSALTSGDSHEE